MRLCHGQAWSQRSTLAGLTVADCITPVVCSYDLDGNSLAESQEEKIYLVTRGVTEQEMKRQLDHHIGTKSEC